MAIDNFDLNSFNMDDYGHGFDNTLLPPGSYRAMVTKCFTEKFPTHGWIGIIWSIAEGEQKNEEFFQFIQLNDNPYKPQSAAALKYGRDWLANTFRAVGFATAPPDWDDLLNKTALLTLTVDEWEGKKRNNLDSIDTDPRVSKAAASKPEPAASQQEEEDFDDAVPF